MFGLTSYFSEENKTSPMELEALVRHLRVELERKKREVDENLEDMRVTKRAVENIKESVKDERLYWENCLEEKDREISMLIENKNKEVTTVIQDRKKSLDDKTKEMTKLEKLRKP